MAQKIHLNGGPWHDRVLAVQDDRDHLHIIEHGVRAGVTREGTYSQVRGIPGEFEWDGWLSHD